MSFRVWVEAGFATELVPIIPPGARLAPGSTVRPEHRGKTPGVQNSDGTWSGLGGKWSETDATIADAKHWTRWGASVGLQSRTFLGLDIDVEDEAVVAAITALAFDHLGFAPERYRAGSARVLRVYRRPDDHDPIRKVRTAWVDKDGVKHAVELLGHGQQYVVEGPHPKGGEYAWREGGNLCKWGPDMVLPIDAEAVDRFFAELGVAIESRGWGTPSAGVVATAGASGARKSLDDASLWAPRSAAVLEALKVWKNTAENLSTHDDTVTALAAIKASLGPDREHHFPDVLDWAMAYDGNDEAYVRKTWDSITDAALGWEWLASQARAAGFSTAEDDFDEDGEALIAETPLERMLARYVWVQQLERYVDLQTGAMLSGRAFNAANTSVAPFGRTGVQSAEAEFQNARGARKAKIATYRPGMPALIDDENAFGTRVSAVNLWHPSPIVPLDGVTEAAVRPWLDLVDALFGEPGAEAREHFLDWWAYAIQKPGRKINHALVLLGEQGVGKDTVLAPLFDAVGMPHNVAVIKTEQLSGQFNAFLLAQVINVQEMANFTKREIYNKLKDWIAAPPAYIEVNRKNQQPFSIPNIQLWVFSTNYDDAITLDEGDRRFWVHRALLDEPRPRDYYQAIYGWYEREQGAAKIAGWLRTRDLSKFNPAAPPPMTEAKRDMVEQSLPIATRWLAEQFDEGGEYQRRSIVTARELVTHARSAFDAPGKVQETAREKHATAALRRAGYAAIERKVRLKDGAAVRLWTNSGRPDLLGQLSGAQLLQRYEAELAAGGAPKQKEA
jgi:hypothetical protein